MRGLCIEGKRARLIWRQMIAAVILPLLFVLAACQDMPPTPTPATTIVAGAENAALPTLNLAELSPTNTATPTPPPAMTNTAVPPATATDPPVNTANASSCFYSYTLIGSSTTPSAELLPGTPFWQTWRVRNDGTCAWGAGAAWVFTSGDQMGGPDLISLPPAGPGQTVDVNLALAAPMNPGAYSGMWQPQMADGLLLQPPSPVEIRVVAAAITSTPTSVVVAPTPTAVPPTPTPTPVISGWRGEYFNNQTLSGTPVLVRDDPEINFTWGTASPGAGLQNGNFSARWTRTISTPGGAYRFFARSEDGVRVWVNGAILFDEWHNGQTITYQGNITLQPGQLLEVRVEYYHATGLANVRVWAEAQTQFPQWRGAYMADPNLQGQPVIVRNDPEINFNWGVNAPAAGLPANNFSVIWLRTFSFAASGYRFQAMVDDGMRLYVDDILVIDAWQDGTARQVSGTITLAAGQHDLIVTYYERHDSAQIQVWWEQVAGFE